MPTPQHVWVDETNTWDGTWVRPGIVFEWRRSERHTGTWEALCVWAGDTTGSARQGWLSAAHVRPVGGDT